ncbi:WEB family protein [Senna tora]|uniref:WEB family protein n=1 Tax=Senna tora TaxID=362788 RepID=A0A834SUD2_9FABA|nr:WEB family protein [Senna tora]
MDPQTLDFASTVDTSRPFRSVKEAVAVFGERLLLGEVYSPAPVLSPAAKPKRENSWRFTPSPAATATATTSKGEDNKSEDHYYYYNSDQKLNNSDGLLETLKKLEAELEQTKVELKLLKERESETEVALATLNAELHKNMSKMARAEAAAAGKAAAKTVRFDERENSYYKKDESNVLNSSENTPFMAGAQVSKEAGAISEFPRQKYRCASNLSSISRVVSSTPFRWVKDFLPATRTACRMLKFNHPSQT